jgi:hypothetical protein
VTTTAQAVDEPLYAHHLARCPYLQQKRPYVDALFRAQSQDGVCVRGMCVYTYVCVTLCVRAHVFM